MIVLHLQRFNATTTIYTIADFIIHTVLDSISVDTSILAVSSYPCDKPIDKH